MKLAILISSWIAFSVSAQNLLTTESDTGLISEGLSMRKDAVQIDTAWFGAVDFHAIATGNALMQTNPIPNDYKTFVDLANAQIILKKEKGLIQFYIQGGWYSTPSIGTTYQRSSLQTRDSFGLVPLASISLAPSRAWLITAGKINSFGGHENTFTFQNNNIDRGLLWNQTSNVSKGVQLTYQTAKAVAALTLNDGFYSNQLSWLGASVAHQLNQNSNLSLVWTGAIRANASNTFITPVLQNNSQIVNAIYAYQTDRLSISPYLQYTYVPQSPSLGILTSAQTVGAAILTNYRPKTDSPGKVSLPFRLEYISSSGKGNGSAPNLLYGPGSAAWSVTITPTYQFEAVFIRGEISYVQAIQASMGQAFGSTGNANTQTRMMLEFGIVY